MGVSNLIAEAVKGRWDEARARAWYEAVPWPVGCNFIPSGAVNQLEMWQADTFNPKETDRELGWLAGLGMNTARVFLHDLLWKQDARGFLARIGQFLDIAERHRMRIMFVFFDSCWHASPELGPQRAPTPRVHNSFWVQSPGTAIVGDPAAFEQLRDYVSGVVTHFCHDTRVLAWDVWNEPDNLSANFAGGDIASEQKAELISPLLAKAFQWVRSSRPTQPSTSGVWRGDWSSDDKLIPLHRLQLFASDVPYPAACDEVLQIVSGRLTQVIARRMAAERVNSRVASTSRDLK